MSFLSIPIKKASQADVAAPLSKYSKNKFPKSDHSVAISDFAQLRKNVSDRCQDKAAGNQSTLEALIAYFDQLLSAEKKLPISENEIRMEFKWQDAFGKDSSKQFAVAYEKACILFNIAACYSQLACTATAQENDEQLKAAAKYFQQSAGIFSWLRENPSGSVASPKADLSNDVLLALSSLMIAQAQELFYRKAYTDKLKDASAARLAVQASDFYQQAVQQLKIVDIWPRDWIPTANAKQNLLMASAQVHQAATCAAEQRFGEQICRLQNAYDLTQSAEKMVDSSSSLKKQAKDQAARVKTQLDAAIKDNDFIYHEPIPKVDAVAAITRAPLAKPIPPDTPFNKGGSARDLFGEMVPLQVADSLATFESRRGNYVQAEVTRLRDATSFLNTVLASLGLPAAVDELLGGDQPGKQQSLPTTLLTAAERIRQAGGANRLLRDISEIPSLCSRNREILDECQRLLEDEQASDDKLRAEFGASKWTRTPSANLTQSMRSDIAKNKQTLEVAAQADQVVRQKWENHRESLELLSKPPTEMLLALPSNSGNAALVTKMANNQAVRDLRECLQKIEALKAERDNLEVLVKEQRFDNMQGAFLEALMRDGAINEEALSATKLNERFAPLREQITASLQKQDELLNHLQSLHAKFIDERQRAVGGDKVNDPTTERDRLLGRLQAAAAAFTELQNHLDEGKSFYARMTDVLLKLQGSISDFTFARKTEKEDLMLSIQQSAAAGLRQEQQRAQQPPARPPPPAPQPTPQPIPAQYYQPQQQAPPVPPANYLPYPVNPPPGGAPPMPSGAPYNYAAWPANQMSQTWGPGMAPPAQLPYPAQPGQNPYYPQYFPPPR